MSTITWILIVIGVLGVGVVIATLVVRHSLKADAREINKTWEKLAQDNNNSHDDTLQDKEQNVFEENRRIKDEDGSRN